jgi:GT2 family glycosyltransferase
MNSLHAQVTIIILNWNGWEDTIECLESLYQIDYPNYDVIVVDNNSTDESIERIREYCNGNIKPKSKFYTYKPENKPIKIYEYNENSSNTAFIKPDGYNDRSSDERLILIKNNENYGFAEGNNIGIRFSLKTLHPDYLLLLNNDTVVEPHFLTDMVNTGDRDENIAVVGPKTYFYNFDGRDDVTWSVGGTVNLSHYPGYHDIKLEDNPPIDKNSVMMVDWISGAVMLIKTRMLPPNLLNSDFFFGCEDVDLCIEMEHNGYHMVTDLKSTVWHKAGASKSRVKFRGISKEIKTNLKFMKTHEKNYWLHLPIYILQIIYRYTSMYIKKIARDM